MAGFGVGLGVQIPELEFLGLWDGRIFFLTRELDGRGKMLLR